MKIILFITLILSASCKTNQFKVGDCLQKPDSIEVFKIVKIEKESLKLISTREKESKEISANANSLWIKTNCN